MSLSVFTVFLDNTIVNTALPALSRELAASTETLQWVVSAYVLVVASLVLLGGTVADRYGRRRWLGIGWWCSRSARRGRHWRVTPRH